MNKPPDPYSTPRPSLSTCSCNLSHPPTYYTLYCVLEAESLPAIYGDYQFQPPWPNSQSRVFLCPLLQCSSTHKLLTRKSPSSPGWIPISSFICLGSWKISILIISYLHVSGLSPPDLLSLPTHRPTRLNLTIYEDLRSSDSDSTPSIHHLVADSVQNHPRYAWFSAKTVGLWADNHRFQGHVLRSLEIANHGKQDLAPDHLQTNRSIFCQCRLRPLESGEFVLVSSTYHSDVSVFGGCLNCLDVNVEFTELMFGDDNFNSLPLSRVLAIPWAGLYIPSELHVIFTKPDPPLQKWLNIRPMTDPSLIPSLALNNSPNGSLDHQNHVSPPSDPTKSGVTAVLDGSRCNSSGQPTPVRPVSYSDTLKLGVGSHGCTKMPYSESEFCPDLRQSQPTRNFSLGRWPKSNVNDPLPENYPPNLHQPPSISLEELLACCLLGKIWGEPLPLPAIIHRTRNEWKCVKGQVEYVEMGNRWILLRFANAEDKLLVFDQRPYFVNGLNFVLKPWVEFFDPYQTSLD